jgi:hypothetical protein
MDRHLRLAGGVQVCKLGRPHHVRPMRAAQVDVGFERARIARQVLGRAELRRVDEYADHDRVALGARRVDEGGVPRVQGAQGRHQPHRRGKYEARCGEVDPRTDDVHVAAGVRRT